MIVAEDIPDVTARVARRVIAVARSIAPCLDTLADNAREEAIAILTDVAVEIPAPGTRRTTSLSRNGTAMTFESVRSAFSDDDRTALRALCASAAAQGLPRGSFPAGGVVGRLWPEDRCS